LRSPPWHFPQGSSQLLYSKIIIAYIIGED
jgi:hypothetical protein